MVRGGVAHGGAHLKWCPVGGNKSWKGWVGKGDDALMNVISKARTVYVGTCVVWLCGTCVYICVHVCVWVVDMKGVGVSVGHGYVWGCVGRVCVYVQWGSEHIRRLSVTVSNTFPFLPYACCSELTLPSLNSDFRLCKLTCGYFSMHITPSHILLLSKAHCC